MALQRDKPMNIPKDAIILNEEEAILHQYNFLKKWKDQNDLWALKYGATTLATLSALTGLYINNHFRTRLKLLHYGQLSTYIPLCLLPPVVSFFLHNGFVVPSVMLQKDCAVCIQMRSSAIQAFSGVLFPYVLAPMATFSIALRYNTYPIPYVTSEPMEVISLLRKFTKPIGNKLFFIFLTHAVTAAVLTNCQTSNINKVRDKSMLLEDEYELKD